MSEPENFLERWSRMKREAAEAAAPAPPPEPEKKADPVVQPQVAEPDEPFDLDSLPSLDSIGADTDVRGFLQPGVPDDLRHEALRRAWAADPGVRDFVELLENGWDFNEPNAVQGFGPIAADEVARLMAQFVLTPPEQKEVAAAKADKEEESAKPVVQSEASAETGAASHENAAVQNKSTDDGQTRSRPDDETT